MRSFWACFDLPPPFPSFPSTEFSSPSAAIKCLEPLCDVLLLHSPCATEQNPPSEATSTKSPGASISPGKSEDTAAGGERGIPRDGQMEKKGGVL